MKKKRSGSVQFGISVWWWMRRCAVWDGFSIQMNFIRLHTNTDSIVRFDAVSGCDFKITYDFFYVKFMRTMWFTYLFFEWKFFATLYLSLSIHLSFFLLIVAKTIATATLLLDFQACAWVDANFFPADIDDCFCTLFHNQYCVVFTPFGCSRDTISRSIDSLYYYCCYWYVANVNIKSELIAYHINSFWLNGSSGLCPLIKTLLLYKQINKITDQFNRFIQIK